MPGIALPRQETGYSTSDPAAHAVPPFRRSVTPHSPCNGPVLACNPTLADHILMTRVTGQHLAELELLDQAQLRRTSLPTRPAHPPFPTPPRSRQSPAPESSTMT